MAKKMVYFEFNDIPAYVEANCLPCKMVKGKEVVIYDLEKFFRESTVISKKEYDELMKDFQ